MQKYCIYSENLSMDQASEWFKKHFMPDGIYFLGKKLNRKPFITNVRPYFKWDIKSKKNIYDSNKKKDRQYTIR